MAIKISEKELSTYVDGQRVELKCLYKEGSIKKTKSGKDYIDGVLQSEGNVFFKAWENSEAFGVLRSDVNALRDKVVEITGTVNIYNGMLSIIVNTIGLCADQSGKDEYYVSKYNTDSYYNALLGLANGTLTDNANSVFLAMIEPVADRFKVEFAAKSHHDNCKSGLLAHTYKVTTLAKVFCNLYKNLNLDLVILGALIHDIGKIYEYDNGVMSSIGEVISHHALGVEYLTKFKGLIEEKMGIGAYYRLMSIIETHHGEYGEAPRTYEAYIVHLADTLDAQLTVINEAMGEGIALRHGDFLLK